MVLIAAPLNTRKHENEKESDMPIKTISINAPASWASAIINGDYSGLDKQERSNINEFLAREGLSFADAIDAQDAGFMRDHPASDLTGAAECMTYVFPR
jgi:hypothetical protein